MKPRRILKIDTEAGAALAVWEKIHGVWSCTSASWPVRWLVGMNPGEAKLALVRMGANWAWEIDTK